MLRKPAVMERLEPRRFLAAWFVEPAWDAPDYSEADYHYGLNEHGPFWSIDYRVEVDGGYELHRAEGDRFRATYDEMSPTRPDAPGPDFDAYLEHAAEHHEREYFRSYGTPIDFEPVLHGDGVFSFVGTLLSQPVAPPAPEGMIRTLPDATVRNPLAVFDLLEGMSIDQLAAQVRLEPVFIPLYTTPTTSLDEAPKLVLNDAGQVEIRLPRTQTFANGRYRYTVDLIQQDTQSVLDTADGTLQCGRLHGEQWPENANVDRSLRPIVEIEYQGQTVRVVKGEWTVTFEASAPGDGPDWEGPFDQSKWDGPDSDPALQANLSALGLGIELQGYLGTLRSIHIVVPDGVTYEQLHAALATLPGFQSATPNFIVNAASLPPSVSVSDPLVSLPNPPRQNGAPLFAVEASPIESRPNDLEDDEMSIVS